MQNQTKLNDDGLYDLLNINGEFDECNTERTENLMFNRNPIDWNKETNMIVNGMNRKSALEGCVNNKPNGCCLSPRSLYFNSRAQENMQLFLPGNMRIARENINNINEYEQCPECGTRNAPELDWCLCCGLFLIKQKNRNLSSDIQCDANEESPELLDASSPCQISQIGCSIQNENFDINIDFSDVSVTVNCDNSYKQSSAAQHKTIPDVPRLDLSQLDSNRDNVNVVNMDVVPLKQPKKCERKMSLDRNKEEIKENVHQKNNTRKWMSSTTCWKDMSDVLLKKKPSTKIGRNILLNFCSNDVDVVISNNNNNDEVGDPEYVEVIGGNEQDIYEEQTVLEVATVTDNVEMEHNVWQCLPAEIWIRIMLLLPHPDLSRLQQTCCRICEIGLHSDLWQSITLCRSNDLSDGSLFSIARKKPKELHFKNCIGTNITINGLKRMFQTCGEYLERLSFISCSKGAFEGDQFLVLSAVFCPNVTHINASYLMNLQDSTLISMTDGFARIVSINLMGAHSISNDSIKLLINKHWPSLSHLDLYGCFRLNSETLRILEDCIHLRSLALGSINKLKRASMIDLLRKLTQLTILDLRGTMNLIDDQLLEQICNLCPNLQQLILTNSWLVSNSGLNGLAKSNISKNLRVLDLCGCTKMNDKGLEVILKHCQKLEDLDISCTGITGRGTKIFKKYPPQNLRCIRINNNKLISESELRAIIHSCKKLKTLYMCGNTSINSWTSMEERYPYVAFRHE